MVETSQAVKCTDGQHENSGSDLRHKTRLASLLSVWGLPTGLPQLQLNTWLFTWYGRTRRRLRIRSHDTNTT